MTRSEGRNLATSLTATVFLIVGTTGVLMYFHLLDQYTKSLHEILGLLFVAAALLHIFFNWKAMQGYFGKRVFHFAAAAVIAVTVGFLANASAQSGPNPKDLLIRSVLEAPIDTALQVLKVDSKSAAEKLSAEGITMENAASLSAIAKNNKTSPFRIVAILAK